MATARAVARGAAWNYAAQIATVLLQLGYAAVTARLLAPHDFGVFAAAFASIQLICLVAIAGLPQIVGRMTVLEPDRLAGLLVYAAAVGALMAAVTVVTAPAWAALWGVPQSAGVLRLLAGSAFLTPLMALGNGLALRLGIFKRLAVRTVAANLLGMVVGAVAAAVLRDAAALAVTPVMSNAAVAALVLGSCRHRFRGRPALGRIVADVRFSGMATVSSLLGYAAGAVGRITVGQSLGTVPLGNWNRADAVTTNPFFTLGTAITQAVFPEFRHDLVDRTRTRRVWADLLGMVAWITMPLGVIASVLAPIGVQLLLGDRYAMAGGFASALAIIGALQPVVYLLISGFEAIGRFSWNWSASLIALVVNCAAAAAAVAVHAVWPVFAGTLLSFALFHALHLVLASREGLVDARRVLGHYARIAAACLLLAAVLFTAVHPGVVVAISPLLPVAVLLVAAGALVRAARRPGDLPPVRLARDYGLLRRRAPSSPEPDRVPA